MSSLLFSLLDTPAYGGAEEYLLTVLFYLRKKGYRVVLATNNVQVKGKCEQKIEVIDLPYRLDAIGNWKGLLKYFIALPGALVWMIRTIRLLQSESSKVICLFPGYTDRLSFSPLIKSFGCRLIWLEYGPLEPTFSRNHGFPKLLYSLGKPFPDKVVTISKWTKQSLVKMSHIPEAKITIIYPGVDVWEHKRVQKTPKHPFTVVAVARLAKEKEIDLLLRAWEKIDGRKAKLVIMGDGPERENLKKLAVRLHVSPSVTFTGFVSNEQKQHLLTQSDLFVFPSAWPLEGFGMTTIEAMALGVSVITTGYGPQEEIVIDGANGWYFHAHDPDDLAKKIQIAMKSKNLKAYGERGRQIAQKKFSQQKMLASWGNIISTI